MDANKTWDFESGFYTLQYGSGVGTWYGLSQSPSTGMPQHKKGLHSCEMVCSIAEEP